MNQNQKVALVSGSTRGIGLAIARKLENDGYLVITNSRNSSDSSKKENFKHIVADVSIPAHAEKLINEVATIYGRLDVLVCNVGSGAHLKSDTAINEYWNHYLTLNLYSSTFLIDAALKLLIENRGRVVSISSICSEDNRISAPIGYSVAKAALQTYIKTMAVRYGDTGVRFNVVSPGNVYFEGSVWDKKLKENKIEVESYIGEAVPLKKFVTPEEVAESVAFLVSERANSITGLVLKVDAGQSL